MADPVLPATARTLLARTARVQRDGRAPSLVAGVVRGGGLAWSAGRGDVADPHTDVQYRLGSISKTVTAVAVMRLRDEGRLGLDEPLDRHVPGTPLGDRTVGQLLSHLAGAGAESPGGWWERVPGGSLAELRLGAEDVVLAPPAASTTPTSASGCSVSWSPGIAAGHGLTSSGTRCSARWGCPGRRPDRPAPRHRAAPSTRGPTLSCPSRSTTPGRWPRPGSCGRR